MSIKTNGSTNYAERTTSLLDMNAAYAIAFDVKVTTNTANAVIIQPGGAAAENGFEAIIIKNTANPSPWYTWVRDAASAVQVDSLTSFSTGVWYHVAIVRESVSSFKLYVDGVLEATNTKDVSARAASAYMEIGRYYRNGSGGGNCDVEIANLKYWSVSKTLEELLVERYSVIPRNPSSLYGWYPTFKGSSERLLDYGGSGRNWTEGGTLADADPPPVPWGLSSSAPIRVAATVAATTRKFQRATVVGV